MSKKIIKFIKDFVFKFQQEGIFKESAALTFVTLLGFVPFMIFIFFLLPELPFLKIQNQFKDLLISIFLPSSAEQISAYITQIINKKISFNLFNFVILIITSFSLFKIINDSFDNILNVHELRKQDFLTNFVKFLGMTIFGGLLILILLSATSIPLVTKFVS
ncbi:MAG: YihY/virulence factor BrkB family protein, partial [Candidatus Cloacimonetes bacterium]|nr:YihY/virulence factor BrkB family protein [Candidatus Cloacimonadota bacterium]